MNLLRFRHCIIELYLCTTKKITYYELWSQYNKHTRLHINWFFNSDWTIPFYLTSYSFHPSLPRMIEKPFFSTLIFKNETQLFVKNIKFSVFSFAVFIIFTTNTCNKDITKCLNLFSTTYSIIDGCVYISLHIVKTCYLINLGMYTENQ